MKILTTDKINIQPDGNLLIKLSFEEVCPESDFVPVQVSIQFASQVLTFVRYEMIQVDGAFVAYYKHPDTGWLLRLTNPASLLSILST